jgi:sugar O-acyltransferase (sialic acid O-acetyltransferase NeuD family)
VLDIVEAINDQEPTYEFLGFLDNLGDTSQLVRRRGAKVIGPFEELASVDAQYVIGLGSPQLRKQVAAMAAEACREAATLTHPLVSTGSDVRLEPGVILAAGSRITTNVSLGEHAHVNVGATVSHDCELAGFATLSPGVHLSGNVRIGEGTLLGTGAVVIPGVAIGDWAVIGAGAVVTADLASGVTAVGVPAKVLTRDPVG